MLIKFNIGDIISFTPHNFNKITGKIVFIRNVYLGYLNPNIPTHIQPSFTEYTIRTKNNAQITINDASLRLTLNVPATLRNIKENESKGLKT